MSKEHFDNCSLHLYYGGEFFNSLKNGSTAWKELTSILTEYRVENAKNEVEIPDFGSSVQIYRALVDLAPKHWNKLNSDDYQYVLLRKELFSSGDNIEKARVERRKRMRW